MTGPLFAAFVLAAEDTGRVSARLGFTVPRAFGKAVLRNRAKRRIREALRLRLPEMDERWDIVINPRRPALTATPEKIGYEVERLVAACKRS